MEKSLSILLSWLEAEAQCSPDETSLSLLLSKTRDALRNHQNVRIRGVIHGCHQWLQFGDKGPKFFFNLLKQKNIRENIDTLLVDGVPITNLGDISEAFASFYQNLFSSKDNSHSKARRSRFLSIIPQRISREDVVSLDQAINIGEIVRAIHSLKDGKASGPNGLPAEFYKSNIDWIAQDLLDVYTEALVNGSLGSDINRGIIKLIPKDGDKTLMKNWCPITLLNVSYKILSKALATRLENILPKFISSTQTSFIKGRYILENLITSWEAMEWERFSEQNSAMLLLDFEKAYDRIEWDFVLSMLKAFGFPASFCNMVKVLFQDASALIEINGSLSSTISLSRSIRQGCPLAPALFIIASEALGFLLKDNSLSPCIRSIMLPDDSQLLNLQFTDDTSLFLELSKTNFENLHLKFQDFSDITGAKISQAKSILLGWDDTPPDWITQTGFQWEGPNKIVRYLGIPLSLPPLKTCGLGSRKKSLRNFSNGTEGIYISLADSKSVKIFYLPIAFITLLPRCSLTTKSTKSKRLSGSSSGPMVKVGGKNRLSTRNGALLANLLEAWG